MFLSRNNYQYLKLLILIIKFYAIRNNKTKIKKIDMFYFGFVIILYSIFFNVVIHGCNITMIRLGF